MQGLLLRLAGALCLLLASPLVSADCQLTRYAESTLAVSPGGSLLVPARLAGQDVWIALQMSSSLAMISPAAVRHLGLKTGRVRGDARLMSGGQPIERETNIESLMVGGANFTDWVMYVAPGEERPLPMFRGLPVIGALSSRFMNAVDMELDLAAERLQLFQHASCRGEQVYWSKQYTAENLFVDRSGLLLFPMEVNGRRLETSLNTQGPRARMSESIARRYFDFERSANIPQARRGAPPGQIVGQRRMNLTSKELSIPDVAVHVYDEGERRCGVSRAERASGAIGFESCFGIVPFEIGTDVLKQLRIYIASKEERIYFTRNGP